MRTLRLCLGYWGGFCLGWGFVILWLFFSVDIILMYVLCFIIFIKCNKIRSC